MIRRMPYPPPSRTRLRQRQADAADQQPWRCAKCNEPVSQIRRNHCACTRELLEAPKETP